MNNYSNSIVFVVKYYGIVFVFETTLMFFTLYHTNEILVVKLPMIFRPGALETKYALQKETKSAPIALIIFTGHILAVKKTLLSL